MAEQVSSVRSVRRLFSMRLVALPVVYSFLDQASVSGANFIVNLLMARQLTSEEFGAFTLVFSGFLLAGIVHTALVTDPMLVLGNERFEDNFGRYVRIVRRLNWWFSALLSAPLVVGAIISVILDNQLASSFLGWALAGPFILFHWTARRACYAARRPEIAARADFTYLVLVPVVALTAGAMGILTAFVGALIIGAGSGLVGWFAFSMVQLPREDRGAISDRAVVAAHVTSGKWLLGSGFLRWLQGNGVLMIATAFIGLSAAGELRVLTLVLMPISQSFAAISPVLAPTLTRAGNRQFVKVLGLAIGSLVALTAGYYVLLLLFGPGLLTFVFGAPYGHLSPLLAILGLTPIFSAVSTAMGAALLARLKTRGIFWATLISAAVSVVAVFVLAPVAGLAGAVIATLAGVVALSITLLLRLSPILFAR